MMENCMIRNVYLPDGRHVDLSVAQGKIAAIDTAGASKANPAVVGTVIEGDGKLLIPAMVDAHNHPDKTVLGLDWFANTLGPDITDRIANERSMRYDFGVDPYTQSCRLIERSIACGVLYARSHVDIDTNIGLRGLEGMLRAREAYRDRFDFEIVAFPQSGLVCRPGTVALIDEALAMGADLVGGLDPAAIDRDPRASVKAVFELADKHGKPVDIHLHEANELGGFSTELIIEATESYGMQQRVTISHAFCLGSPSVAMVGKLLEGLARAGIAIVTAGQLYSGHAPAVKQVMGAGVAIAGGNDNIRDLWSPFGSGDMLERAQFIAMKNSFRNDKDLDLSFEVCSYAGAKLLGLPHYGIDVGCYADLVLVPARCVAEAVVAKPAQRTVMRRGKIVQA